METRHYRRAFAPVTCFALTALLVALAVPRLFGSDPAGAQQCTTPPPRTESKNFAVLCPGGPTQYPQTCGKDHEIPLNLTTPSNITVDYRQIFNTNVDGFQVNQHCASLYIDTYLDNQFVKTSPILRPNDTSTTQLISVDNVPAGTQKVRLRARSANQPGDCALGNGIYAWAGNATLNVQPKQQCDGGGQCQASTVPGRDFAVVCDPVADPNKVYPDRCPKPHEMKVNLQNPSKVTFDYNQIFNTFVDGYQIVKACAHFRIETYRGNQLVSTSSVIAPKSVGDTSKSQIAVDPNAPAGSHTYRFHAVSANFPGDCALGRGLYSWGGHIDTKVQPLQCGGGPACSDGIDNDGDTLVDSQDPGCANPQDNDESNGGQCTPFTAFDRDFAIECDTKVPGKIYPQTCPKALEIPVNLQNPSTVTLDYRQIHDTFVTYPQPFQVNGHCGSFYLDTYRGNQFISTVGPLAPAQRGNTPTSIIATDGAPAGNHVYRLIARRADLPGDCAIGEGIYAWAGHTKVQVQPLQCGGSSSSSSSASCSDGFDNDFDGRADSADPGCHFDFNPGNPGSYTPSDNNEGDEPQCADGRDNDGDNRTDVLDPGCHFDFNPGNFSSYTPSDNNEGDEPQCANGKDDADPEDALSDAADPGCHFDGNPANLSSYVPTDPDETDSGGGSSAASSQASSIISSSAISSSASSAIQSSAASSAASSFVASSAQSSQGSSIASSVQSSPASSLASSTTSSTPACRDGVDNDGDGAIDFPSDVSCSTPDDNDELNPKPACQDELDNDGDGLVDLNDPGCSTRQDNDESNPTASSASASSASSASSVSSVSSAPGQAVLTVAKSDGRSTAAPGDVLSYTITITNAGTAMATNVHVVDALPGEVAALFASDGGQINGQTVTWLGLTIGAGQTRTLTVQVQVRHNVSSGTGIRNVALIAGSATATDVTTVDNPQSQIGCVEILNETFSPTGAPLPVAAAFTYTLDNGRTVTTDAAGRARFDNVPVGTHVVSQTLPPSGWSALSVTPVNGILQVSGGPTCVGVVFKNRQNPVQSVAQSSFGNPYNPYVIDNPFRLSAEERLCRMLQDTYGNISYQLKKLKKKSKKNKSLIKMLEKCEDWDF